MRRELFFGAVAFARLATTQNNNGNDDDDDSSDTEFENRPRECFPNDPTAPCVSIENIESICMQDGVSLEDHKRCMCDGSYFQDWNGCRQCLHANGFLAEAQLEYWTSVMGDASTSVCDSDSAPTAWVQEYFASAGQNATQPPDGTQEPTVLVSGTAVSLYYTAPDNQGPGITPTVTPQTESRTGTGSETETDTGTTSSDGSTTTETETQTRTGDGQGNGDEDDAAGRVYAQGAAVVAAIMAGGALFLNM